MSLSANRGEIVCFGVFAWIILALVFAFAGRQDRRVLDKHTPRELAFCLPFTLRIFMVMMAVLMAAGWPLVLYAEGGFDSGGRSPSMTTDTWFLFGLNEMIGIAVGIPIFYASGPNDFVIDLDRRTYRHVYGWPFHPQVKTGTIDDEMKGIYVRCVQMNVRYDVGLIWKRTGKWKQLGMFNRSGQADRFAEETASALGLPLVSPPSSLKSSSDVRNGLP